MMKNPSWDEKEQELDSPPHNVTTKNNQDITPNQRKLSQSATGEE